MSKNYWTGKNKIKGFTLIEVMIVVVIISILAAIAYPAYTQYIKSARRADAKTALLDLASRQERYFSTRNVYAGTPNLLGYSGSVFPIDVLTGSQAYYKLDINLGTPPTSYSATATALGVQATDACGNYKLTHLGVQDNSSNTTPTSKCW